MKDREPGYNMDNIPEPIYDDSREQPSPEMMLMRQAAKYLTPKQRAIWEYHNFDRLTQDEIAEKVGISHQVVSKHIRAIEKKITKWVKSNWGAYELLKHDYRREL